MRKVFLIAVSFLLSSYGVVKDKDTKKTLSGVMCRGVNDTIYTDLDGIIKGEGVYILEYPSYEKNVVALPKDTRKREVVYLERVK